MIRRSITFTKGAVNGITTRDLSNKRLAAAWKNYSRLGDKFRRIVE